MSFFCFFFALKILAHQVKYTQQNMKNQYIYIYYYTMSYNVVFTGAMKLHTGVL